MLAAATGSGTVSIALLCVEEKEELALSENSSKVQGYAHREVY